MNRNTLQFTPLQNRIFRLLCIKAGQKLNQRQIAKNLKATPSGIAKAILELEQSGLLHIERSQTMNLNLITLSRNQETLRLKQIENLKQIYELELIEALEESDPGTTIILFGSYARGEDTATSDIDIAIIGTKPKDHDLEIFEKELERNINISSYESLNDISKELKENLFNGILLAGGIEL